MHTLEPFSPENDNQDASPAQRSRSGWLLRTIANGFRTILSSGNVNIPDLEARVQNAQTRGKRFTVNEFIDAYSKKMRESAGTVGDRSDTFDITINEFGINTIQDEDLARKVRDELLIACGWVSRNAIG